MKRAALTIQAWVITVLFTALLPRVLRADGGTVLLHETHEPFSVTVFAAPGTCVGAPVDVSVLVQSSKNGEVVLDADVSVVVAAPKVMAAGRQDPLCGVSTTNVSKLADMNNDGREAAATRQQASNKLLYAVPLKFNSAGDRQLHVYVLRGPESASFDCRLPVMEASGKLATVWPCLAIPPIVVVLFAMNQWLRRRALQHGFKFKSSASLRNPRPEIIVEQMETQRLEIPKLLDHTLCGKL
jgi:hypothetical protein